MIRAQLQAYRLEYCDEKIKGEDVMKDDLDVRIVKLEPMRVAWVNGYGAQPETEAWQKILAYAKSQGLLEDLKDRRFFGYNNPDPSPGTPNYGYDQWITVEQDSAAQGEVEIMDFEGGTYAVATCVGVMNITDTWKALVKWFENSKYEKGNHQWLEEVLNPEVFINPDGTPNQTDETMGKVKFDLYLPIVA
jgi:DNA gyrase inhibitor GyrI